MVITNNHPNKDNSLEKLLQPFHEYECTGVVDEYVKHVDILTDFSTQTTTLVKMSDGTLINKYDNQFWPRVDGSMSFIIPEDAEQIELPNTQLANDVFKQAIIDDFGIEEIITLNETAPESDAYIRLNNEGKVIEAFKYTNPNAKWDWWRIGGRWGSALLSKTTAQQTDICQVNDLDLTTMQAGAVCQRITAIQSKLTELPDNTLELWKNHTDSFEATKAQHKAANTGQCLYDWLKTQPTNPTQIINEAGVSALGDSMFGIGIPDNQPDPMAWANQAPALSAFGYLKDGEWHEKGSMGWWG